MSDLAIPVAVPDSINTECMRGVFESLLNTAEIRQLVIVDDSFNKNNFDIEDIILMAQQSPSLFAKLISPLNSMEATDTEMISDSVRTALESNPDLRQRAGEIYQQKKSLDKSTENADIRDDNQTLSILETLVNTNNNAIEMVRLSGKQWQEQKKSLLDPQKGGSLVLIDRDFSLEGQSADHGVNLIADLLTNPMAEKGVYCALLTHTVAPDAELDEWRGLAERHQIPQDKFVVISKHRLAEERPDIAGFLHLIRMAILCGPLQTLRNKVRDHFSDAIQKTQVNLNQWSVFDFDEAIFGSSRNEGVWEGETLLRVMMTFITQTARSCVLSNGEIQQLIGLARKTSEIQIPVDEQHPWRNIGQMALKYQRSELYIEASDINHHHLPITTGDIFDRGDNKERYILLAQPCDLMVRNGKRAHSDNHSKLLPLFQIRDSEARGEGQSYQLQHWHPNSGKSAFVHFSRVHFVCAAILDLCTLQTDGFSHFDNNKALPESLNNSWRKHIVDLKKHLCKESVYALQLAELLKKAGADEKLLQGAKSKVLPFSNTGRFKADFTPAGFSINLRRVGRITPMLATDILRALARYQSRTAFDQSVVTENLGKRMKGASASAEDEVAFE